MIEKYYNQPCENSFLYRYITIDKLLDLLISEQIPLVRLDLFEDKLEGTTLEHLILNHHSEKDGKEMQTDIPLLSNISVTINPNKRNQFSRQREAFQKTNYSSCWYINNYESVAMWQLYSKPDSVAVRIPYKILNKELQEENYVINSDYEKISYGSISYHRFKNIISEEKDKMTSDQQGFIKDSSFEHEQEFRIIVENREYKENLLEVRENILDEEVDEINKSNQIYIKHLKFNDFSKLPFEIIFHPQCQTWHKSNIKKLLSQFSINFKAFDSDLTSAFK
jgi:hypothetical protein